jgi:hypothetical protein
MSRFMAKHRLARPELYGYTADHRDGLIVETLGSMVVNPPDIGNGDAKRIWKDWWYKNKDTAVFIIPAAQSYE